MSDHIPVIMKLQTDQVFAITDETIIKNLIHLSNSNIIKNKLSLKIDVKLLNEKLIIFNSLGQKVKKISIDNVSITNNLIIDATNLGNGIYYIGVENFTYNKPIKFVKI